MVFVYKKLAQFAVRGALPPRRSESPVCATDNKPSCVLHLLGWFIGSRGFSSLERRPEFWVLHQSLLKFMSIELVMPSIHLILCYPLLLSPSIFPSIRVLSNESVLCQSIGASASASVLPMNIQDWFPLGWTGWISLQSKELSRIFSNTTVQKHQFFSAQLSL